MWMHRIKLVEVVHFTVLHPGKLISFAGVVAADDIARSIIT